MTTPLDQLAKIIAPTITSTCMCGQQIIRYGHAYAIADAIIRAGWTAPPTDKHNTVVEKLTADTTTFTTTDILKASKPHGSDVDHPTRKREPYATYLDN